MTRKVGAFMSRDVWTLFSEIGPEFGVDALWLGETIDQSRAMDGNSVSALLIELSELVVPEGAEMSRTLRDKPRAGLPMNNASEGLAEYLEISTMISSPEGLSDWLASVLAPPHSGQTDNRGHIVAVWGPHGSPGRTTLAINLAAELSLFDAPVALVDADTVAPSIALGLLLTEHPSGLVSAIRSSRIADATPESAQQRPLEYHGKKAKFRVLSGISDPRHWQKIEPDGLKNVLVGLRESGVISVVDISAELDGSDGGEYGDDPRHRAARVALECADSLIVLATADHVGIARFSRSWATVRTLSSDSAVYCLLRARVNGKKVDMDEAQMALWQFTGIEEFGLLPHDAESVFSAWQAGSTLADLELRGPLRIALTRVAQQILTAIDPTSYPVRDARAAKITKGARKISQ